VRWTTALDGERQRVYFANHTSHLDFVIIWSALPPAMRRRTRPVAGADYWERGAVKRFLSREVFRAILIERARASSSPSQASKSIEQIAQGMREDHSIIVFPEGTRSLDGEVLPFKSGMYHLCRLKPGLELVPVYLANMNRILPKGEVLPVPLLGRVIFGTPMRLDPGEEKDAFLARTRDALLSLRDQ
jgi:1-acyl-sn-glycerol-3-phosphate acyltransferase